MEKEQIQQQNETGLNAVFDTKRNPSICNHKHNHYT